MIKKLEAKSESFKKKGIITAKRILKRRTKN